MSTLMQASTQWRTRPDDQRYLDLPSMHAAAVNARANSRAVVASSRGISFRPAAGAEVDGLELLSPNGHAFAPTNYAFGQLAQLAEAPAGYLRTLPAPVAADCLNYGLQFKRDTADVGLLLYRNGGAPEVRAATGPRYGRIWNADVIGALMRQFGDGRTGAFKVPGEFGEDVDVTKANTTLYASDRDMFVFLADEHNRIEVPNRRDGKTGTMARGFFVWNSEVGDKTLGISTFLYDYVCCNRIVWGASEVNTITVRHTASAPDKFVAEIAPALRTYADSSAAGVTQAIAAARAARIGDTADVREFLAKRFGARQVAAIEAVHMLEESRPIETLWDATTAVTAWARSMPHQDRRVEVERAAGAIFDMAS